MATVELTKDNFEQTVNDNPMVIVDFWAPWCGPCRGFAPVYEKASETHADVVFAKVNTDEQQELAGAFDIRSIPTLMVFREKVILFQQAGRAARPGARAGHHPGEDASTWRRCTPRSPARRSSSPGPAGPEVTLGPR